MLRYILPAFMLAVSPMPDARAADAPGFREAMLPGTENTRALHIALWYPAKQDGPVKIVGENRVFHGIEALPDARPEEEAHPLVILSHGYGGSWRNLNWLAAELVKNGYAVAAADHPGTTTFNRDPAEAAKLWERPRDLSRVIDALIADTSLAGAIQSERIAAIGHSLGGWTVAALAGARFDAERFAADCTANPNPRTCGLTEELGLSPEDNHLLEADLSDARIGAAVSLDLGLARGFTPESLATIRTPLLVFGAGIDIGDLPADEESGYLAAHLNPSRSQYTKIPDAAHFSFMQLCKPGAAALIEAEAPGDGIVCMDGGERTREAIHRQVAGQIIDFLSKAIPPR